MANEQNKRTLITTKLGNSSVISNNFKITATNIVPASTDGSTSYEFKSDKFIVEATDNDNTTKTTTGRSAYYFYDYDFWYDDDDGEGTIYGNDETRNMINITSFSVHCRNSSKYPNLCTYATGGISLSYQSYKFIARKFKDNSTTVTSISDPILIEGTNIVNEDGTKANDYKVTITVNNIVNNTITEVSIELILHKVIYKSRLTNNINLIKTAINTNQAYLQTLTIEDNQDYNKVVLWLTDTQIVNANEYENADFNPTNEVVTTISNTLSKITSTHKDKLVNVIVNIHYLSMFKYKGYTTNSKLGDKPMVGMILELVEGIDTSLYNIFASGITDSAGVKRRYTVGFVEPPYYGVVDTQAFASAIGLENTVTGDYGLAIGAYNKVLDTYGVAIGNGNTCSGYASLVCGTGNTSCGNSQLVIGRYAIKDDLQSQAFIIGGGKHNSDRKNVFSVGWDGTVTLYDPNNTENTVSLTYDKLVSLLNMENELTSLIDRITLLESKIAEP